MIPTISIAYTYNKYNKFIISSYNLLKDAIEPKMAQSFHSKQFNNPSMKSSYKHYKHRKKNRKILSKTTVISTRATIYWVWEGWVANFEKRRMPIYQFSVYRLSLDWILDWLKRFIISTKWIGRNAQIQDRTPSN